MIGIPAFDLLPADARRRLGGPQYRKSIALALAASCLAALMLLDIIRSQVQQMREDNDRAQAQLQHLQALRAQSQRALQSQQLIQAIEWRRDQEYRRWLMAEQALQAAAHPLGLAEGSQLIALRMDSGSLQFIGHSAPQQLQAWLEAVRRRTAMIGPAHLLEITALPAVQPGTGPRLDLLRFVVQAELASGDPSPQEGP